MASGLVFQVGETRVFTAATDTSPHSRQCPSCFVPAVTLCYNNSMRYTNPDIGSFYRSDNLGKIYYDIVLQYKPKKIIEFGTFNGYTAVAMALALDELKAGRILSYDLFEDYPYRHPTLENTKRNISKSGVSQYIELGKKDIYEWLKNPEDFDLLYVDASNTGETIEKTYEALKPRVQKGSIVIFEGGSEARDNAEWMVKYHMRKIGDTKVPYKILHQNSPSDHNPLFSLSMITKE